jgi:hypothetical protein
VAREVARQHRRAHRVEAGLQVEDIAHHDAFG